MVNGADDTLVKPRRGGFAERSAKAGPPGKSDSAPRGPEARAPLRSSSCLLDARNLHRPEQALGQRATRDQQLGQRLVDVPVADNQIGLPVLLRSEHGRFAKQL